MTFGAKAKGSRLEYQLRDHLRSLGYHSERVVLSGAHKDHPGDVYGEKDGKRILFECKSRKDAFKSIYQLLKEPGASAAVTLRVEKAVRFTHRGVCVAISEDLDTVLENYAMYYFLDPKKPTRTYDRVINLRKLVKESDILVVKDNHKPMLFVRFL